MPESKPWDIDRLAAAALLAELGLQADDKSVNEQAIALAAAHFARHRREAHLWACEKARDQLVAKLEQVSTERFANADEEWANGFSHAEMQVAATSPHELLDEPEGEPRSRSQFLRTMIKQARSRKD